MAELQESDERNCAILEDPPASSLNSHSAILGGVLSLNFQDRTDRTVKSHSAYRNEEFRYTRLAQNSKLLEYWRGVDVNRTV
jgi:hypothetical protein